MCSSIDVFLKSHVLKILGNILRSAGTGLCSCAAALEYRVNDAQQLGDWQSCRVRRSIAQGCSEYNITVLIDQKDSVRALRAVHGRFYLATLPLGVGLVGPGLIGGTFLDQIHQQMTVCTLATAVCSAARCQACIQIILRVRL